MPDFQARLVFEQPAPLWVVRVPEGTVSYKLPLEWHEFLVKIDRRLMQCSFRGTSYERLTTVRLTGIDVEPSDSVIFTNGFDKAWEYGDWPKVILALDPAKLRKTFVEVAADMPEHELALLRAEFPTALRSDDGGLLWLSRLPEGDPRTGGAYEVAYARWIKGDAREALKAILVCVRPQDEALVQV